MRRQVTQHNIRGVLAGSRTAERYTVHVIDIDTIRAAGLMKTDIDSLTHIGTQINRVLYPLRFPQLMGGIAFGFGGIIGIQQLKRTRCGSAHRHLDTQFTGRSIIAYTSREMQILARFRTQLRRDQPVLRTCHLLDISAVMLQLHAFLPSIAGIAVYHCPSLRRKTLALKTLIQRLCADTRAEQRCYEQ